mmetsp:Transcript_10447/g.15798  ORF Transcript_10447/g.15798 Transcript_10447/m.15798 type:complete len:218 (+) Transcript_10447:106-759(+)
MFFPMFQIYIYRKRPWAVERPCQDEFSGRGGAGHTHARDEQRPCHPLWRQQLLQLNIDAEAPGDLLHFETDAVRKVVEPEGRRDHDLRKVVHALPHGTVGRVRRAPAHSRTTRGPRPLRLDQVHDPPGGEQRHVDDGRLPLRGETRLHLPELLKLPPELRVRRASRRIEERPCRLVVLVAVGVAAPQGEGGEDPPLADTRAREELERVVAQLLHCSD